MIVLEAHNDYLQLAAEGGLLVGVPIVLTLVIFGGWNPAAFLVR